ncbi:putative transporter [Teredinibacter turnerae T7901]|uniref:Transporter n=1 Tax=Teredinibacter turnerae (strain ATCC 39867 / T7901) TaxID=377629 RepID=C5BJM6_TERTT|nr:putative transporter [Teredinibacter turnerae T7901]
MTLRQLFWFSVLLIAVGESLFSSYSPEVSNSSLLPLKIALVGPMRLDRMSLSQPDTVDKGRVMRESVLLYEQQFNAQVKPNERPLQITVYNDRDSDDPEVLARLAEKIKKDGNIAVIGHRSSRVSKPAAREYAKLGIPMVGGSATASGITENNPWAFRVVPDNRLQAHMALRYFRSSGLFDTALNVAVLFSNDEYGVSMNQAFVERAGQLSRELNMTLSSYAVELPEDGEYSVKQARKMVDRLPAHSGINAIFLAVHDVEGRYLIKALRDNPNTAGLPVVASASIGKQGFAKYFSEILGVNSLPVDHYLDGVFALSPMIYDIAGQSAQNFSLAYYAAYGRRPDSSAASYFDAIHAVVSAAAGVQDNLPIAQQRITLRDSLAELDDPQRPIQGLSSDFFFDELGNVVRPLMVGQFSGERFISAPIQLGYDRGVLYKTHVVYTAIKVKEITDVSLEKNTFRAVFEVWFRGVGGIDIDSVSFVNSVDAEGLDERERVSEKFMQAPLGYTLNKAQVPITYKRYTAERTFLLTEQRGRGAFGEYIAAIEFRHNNLPRKNIIYATDFRGVDTNWGEGLEMDGWQLVQESAFQSSFVRETLGDPELLSASTKSRTSSLYSTVYLLKSRSFSLRGVIPPSLEKMIFQVSLLGWLLVAFVLSWLPLKRLLWLRSIVYAFILLTLEPLILAKSVEMLPMFHTSVISRSFDIAWWVLLAYTLAQGINNYIWDMLDRKARVLKSESALAATGIPTILRTLTSWFCFTLCGFGVIRFVFDMEITHLLATSGLLTFIAGLALQENLTDLFSGLILNIDKPFSIGDKITVNSEICGTVVNMSWRFTSLVTDDNEMIALPNSMLTSGTVGRPLEASLPSL